MIYFSFYHKTHRTWLFFGGLHVWKLVPNRKKTIYLQKDTTYIEIYIKLCIKIWLIQWPAFQLFGITYLTGRIKLTLLFHGALAEITYKISSPTTTVCRQIVRSATVLAPVQSCSVQLIGLTVTWICFLGNFCSDCTILGGRNYGNSKNRDLMLFTWICFLEFFGWFVFADRIAWYF